MPRVMDPRPKSRTKRVTFHLTYDMAKKIEKLADSKNMNFSELIRKAIDKYMDVDQYKDDTEFIAGIVQPIIKDEIGKQTNRLAAMLFKIGIITAGNYFLAVRTLSDVISPSMQEDFKDINANARKLGIDYMKQSGVGAVEFLEDGGAVERAASKLKSEY